MGFATVTDKIEPHGYYPSYLRIAAELGPHASVCEVGVAKGGSLQMWQALFPFGEIAGVDRDTGFAVWPEGTHAVVAEQHDPAMAQRLRAIRDDWDLIVDDCSHDGPLTAATFGLLWPLVAPGGYYVIEDWNGYFQGHPWGDGILAAVQGLLLLLSSRDEAECDRIEYRWGLAIVHKRAP
jgi:cephalosporin hydroxylase